MISDDSFQSVPSRAAASAGPASAAECLSALADGEVTMAETASACSLWRGDAQARATWHAYQLIGDVLRSDDLATDAARDRAFVAELRKRLAQEPVVLAPAPLESTSLLDRRRAPEARGLKAWLAPVAVAAGFMAVAGVLVVSGVPGVPGRSDAPQLAARSAPSPSGAGADVRGGAGADSGVVAVANVAAESGGPAVRPPAAAQGLVALPADALPMPADGRLIRDTRLDDYLAAHKQFAGSSALGLPSGYLRNATVTAPGR